MHVCVCVCVRACVCVCACVCACVVSVLVVLLQRVSLCYNTVVSQDYIPAEQRAGKYLLFISLCLYRSPCCLCLYLSLL